MKTSINLALGNTDVKKKSYAIYVYWIFGMVVAAALVIMSVNIGLKLQFSNLESQERELITAINSQADKKVNMLILSERSKNIISLFSKRGELDKRLADLVGIFPSSVTLSGITASDNEFSLSFKSDNLAAMNTVLEEDLPKHLKESKSGIQMVDISSFAAQEGQYMLTLHFIYPGGLPDE